MAMSFIVCCVSENAVRSGVKACPPASHQREDCRHDWHVDGDRDMTTLTVASGEAIDAKAFWTALGQRATGMTVVTADSDDGPTGFLGLSVAHVTASPPTMLVSVDRKTSALAGILSRRHFAVSFLPATAGRVADAFAGKAGLSGAARFTTGEWHVLSTGAPVYREALGVFDCTVDKIVQHGDISIIIGTVVAVASRADGDPLIFFRGKSHTGLGAVGIPA
jgi:flavin reductase (DIM6/NTAB) family NADH-FMN oxidoreductase RutF